MPEEKTVSMYQQQKAVKPLVEEYITTLLDSDIHKSALDLTAYLRENKMKPSWTLTNQWKSVCKSKNICRITIFAGQPWLITNRKWVITAYLMNLKDYEDVVIGEGLQDYLWNNVLYCVNKPKDSCPPEKIGCNHWNCSPGKTITVCGKELTNICQNSNRQYFWFHDPDEATLKAIKRLLELERKARLEANKLS